MYIYETITLLNPNTTSASVNIIALDKEGYEIDRNALPSLSSMESKTFPLIEIFGPRILKDLSTVRAVSDSNIIGLQLVDYPGVDLVGLPALTTTSKGWTFPIATKGENFGLWTKVGILNPGNDIANVTIVAFDASNNSLGIIQSQTILPGVTYVINTANIDTIDGDAIPLNAAILKVTSNQSVIGYEVIGILDGNGLAAAMGISDEDNTIGGFEITGSTDGGVLNNHSMMRMGDGSVKSTAGSLGNEEWAENVNIIPNTSEINSEPTTEINKNAGVSQNTSTSFTLEFPLKQVMYNGRSENWTPYIAKISSVFDHSMKDENGFFKRLGCDKVVIAYTDEVGNVDPDTQICAKGPGYRFKLEDGVYSKFYVNNNYVGSRKWGPTYLNYDGHPGYDYPVEIGTPVYAAGTGTIVILQGENNSASGKYIRIKHSVGSDFYQTQYLHLNKIKDSLVKNGTVTSGELIGESGDTGTVSAHLHFEVKKCLDSTCLDNNDVPIDPYGWHPPVPTIDPYKTLTDVDNTTLWEAKNTLPQITSISSSSGGADTPVTINGNRFGAAKGTVKFGTGTATVTSWNDNKIVATAPAGNSVIHVRVTTAAGTSGEEIPFAYTSSPTIVTVISPNGGENWQAGSTQTITWKVDNDTSKISNFLVGYSIDGVPNLKKTKTVASSARSLTLPIPSFVSSTQCKVGVKARDAVGNILAEDSSDGNFTISTCQTPGSFTLTATPECNGSSPQIRLNWTASSGATAYDVYRNGSPYYSNVVGTQYMDSSNITPGMTYTYFVKARNSCGSTNSNTASAIATNCNTTVTVVYPNGGESWQNGTPQTIRWAYTGNPGSYVKIELLKGGSISTITSSAFIGSNGSGSYNWTILSTQTTGSDYKVRVTSTTNSSFTDTSDNNFTIATPCQLPGAFTLTATPECVGSSSQIRLNWTASSGATSYDVYRNSSLYYSDVVGTQFINSGNITSGTTYTYYVKAKNSYGSTNSNTVSETASCGFQPGSFTLTATPECVGSSPQIRLNWTASSGATAYDVYRNGSLYYSDVVGTQFINSSNITSGTTYTYYVKAKNSYGSTNSNTVSETASCGSTPLAITDLRATAECDGTTSQIRLNWTASSGATSYDVYRNYSLYYSNVSGTQFINSSNIIAGATYTYSVRAKNTYGSSADSNIVSATASSCGSTPLPITDLRATAECNGTMSQIRLNWTASSGATSYDVYRNYSLYYSNVSGTQFINSSNIIAGATYTYSVRAKNTYGSSADSNIVSATAKDCNQYLPPPPINDLRATAECNGTTSQIRLNWTASSGATSYDVYRNYSLYYSNVSGTQFINSSNIIAGATYTYSVRAKNTYGSSADSNIVSATARFCSSIEVVVDDQSSDFSKQGVSSYYMMHGLVTMVTCFGLPTTNIQLRKMAAKSFHRRGCILCNVCVHPKLLF